jgi:hypothetical protein
MDSGIAYLVITSISVIRVPRDGIVQCLKKSNHFAVREHSVSPFRQLTVRTLFLSLRFHSVPNSSLREGIGTDKRAYGKAPISVSKGADKVNSLWPNLRLQELL